MHSADIKDAGYPSYVYIWIAIGFAEFPNIMFVCQPDRVFQCMLRRYRVVWMLTS